MAEFEKERREMVAAQLRARGIKDPRVLSAMERVPRHLFVPEDMRGRAYDDCPLPVGGGQTISQPYIVAFMTECLALEGGEKVLEVGTGSGYQAAVLAELAEKVYTVERIAELSVRARGVLGELGCKNIFFRVGDGSEGWADEAPYDGIMVTAGAPEVPPALAEQLAEGGRLVIPVGGRGMQELTVIKKEGGNLEKRKVIGCVFVPLLGKYGHGYTG